VKKNNPDEPVKKNEETPEEESRPILAEVSRRMRGIRLVKEPGE